MERRRGRRWLVARLPFRATPTQRLEMILQRAYCQTMDHKKTVREFVCSSKNPNRFAPYIPDASFTSNGSFQWLFACLKRDRVFNTYRLVLVSETHPFVNQYAKIEDVDWDKLLFGPEQSRDTFSWVVLVLALAGVLETCQLRLTLLPAMYGNHFGLTYLKETPLPYGARLAVCRGDITMFKGTAIVNAANENCLGGDGVDGAITKAGGAALKQAREELPINEAGVRCPTGTAVYTSAGELKCDYVIHAVGPNYRTDQDADFLLTKAYASAMRLARGKKSESIAFPILSGGIFKGQRDLKDVIEIGLRAIQVNSYPELDVVLFVAYTDDDENEALNVLNRMTRIDDEMKTWNSNFEAVVKREINMSNAFNQFDANKNGKIGRIEFNNVCKGMGYGDAPTPFTNAIFAALDADNSDNIELHELSSLPPAAK